MSDFVHLHSHGQHSLLDGLTKPDGAIRAALSDGQPAFALTDHGTLGGVMKFAQAAAEHGVKFIPGAELYLSIGPRSERNSLMVPADEDFDGTGGSGGDTRMKRKIYEHLTTLAINPEGWRNLMLVDTASHDSFYMKPRADYELLDKHSAGIVVGTGCLAGPVAGPLMRGDMETARVNLDRLVSIYTRDRVFVEVMDHGIAAEQKVIPGLVELARQFGLPVVATNDLHYQDECDAHAHDAWLAMSASKGKKLVTVDNPDRFRFNGSGYHLRTAAEMHALFDDQPGTERAVANSVLIADMAEDNIVLGSIPADPKLPHLPVPAGFDSIEDYFHHRLRDGLIERYGLPLPPEVRARARFEEDTIINFGVVSYMLIKADALAAARRMGIVTGAGRGSAAGSIAAYALRITNIDPLRHGLLFERFLNVFRKSLPDIDSDFQASRRDEMIRYLQDTYGADHVSRIGTYGRAKAKSALKNLGRVLGQTKLGEELAKRVPDVAGGFRMSDLVDPNNRDGTELRELAAASPEAAALIEQALVVDWSALTESVHACGVVVGDEALAGNVPLRLDRSNGNRVTEWDAADVEKAGLVKFDFLAIADLDVVAACLAMIADRTGEHVDIYNLDPDADDDRARKAKRMLAEGRTAGVFQLGSSGITELTRDIRPESFDDLSAILALYRPGPMAADMHNTYARRRRAGETVDYGIFTSDKAEQAVIAEVLDRTLGTIVYQEQLQQLARDIADFNGGQMSDLQKAFSKKKRDKMDALFEVWMQGGKVAARTDGTTKIAFRKATLVNLWRTFEGAASYLFNSCLTGDTEVLTGRGDGPKAKRWTVERLYHRLHGNPDADPGRCPYCNDRERAPQRRDGMCQRCQSWNYKLHDPARGFQLLAYDFTSGRIKPQQMKDVHFNGVREVFEIVLSDGRRVRATDNHRFLSPEGWIHVRDMRVGGQLMVDGGYESNLKWMCVSCHKAFDYANNGRNRRWGKGRLVAIASIVSIEARDPEPVYDIEMADGTDHDFLANGIVSHNSHAYAYAMLTWQTAYLKANWPAEYGAALLACTDRTKSGKRAAMLRGLIAEGIRVGAPSVAIGDVTTTVSADGAIVLGLADIKGVGEAGRDIVQERNANGPFADLYDLVDRTKVTSATVQALAEAGALDEFGPRLGIAMAGRALRVPGIGVPQTEWGVLERSARQRLRLGVQVDPHPLLLLGDQVRKWRADFRRDSSVMQVHNLPREQTYGVNTIGVVASAEERSGPTGRRLVMVIDSAKESVEAIMWANRYQVFRRAGGVVPAVGQILGLTGTVKVSVPVSEDDETAQDGIETVAEPRILFAADSVWPVPVNDPDIPLPPLPQTETIGVDDTPLPDLPAPEEPRSRSAQPSLPVADGMLPAPVPLTEGDGVAETGGIYHWHLNYRGPRSANRRRYRLAVGQHLTRLSKLFAGVDDPGTHTWWAEAPLGSTKVFSSPVLPEVYLEITISEDGSGGDFDGKVLEDLVAQAEKLQLKRSA